MNDIIKFDETTSQNTENNGSVESKNAERETRHFHLDAETSLGSDLLSPSISASVILTQDKNYGDDMSKSNFLMLVRSEHSEWLQEHYPNAFLLLCQIARRARRTNGFIDGREIGEAHIGDFLSAGIASEKKYRNAKKILVDLGYIEIVETIRNPKKNIVRAEVGQKKGDLTDEKRANKLTTKGTLVKLLKSDIFDANLQNENEEKGDSKIKVGATKGRPKGDEQEYNKSLSIDNDNISCPKSNQDVQGQSTSDNLYNDSENLPEENKKPQSKQIIELKSKKSNKTQIKYSEESFEYKISKRMFLMAQKIFPKKKEPKWQTWCKHVEDMQKIDELTEEEILKVLDWLEKDDFWKKNVRCTEKLRKKFEVLWGYMLPPDKKQKESLKDIVSKRFTNGKIYNGAECFIDDNGIAFQRGMTHVAVKFIEKGFNDQLANTLRRFGICA